jgi:transposase
MAHREVTMLEVKEVLRLWLGGVPKKRIAAGLGLDVKTVRRYLRAAKAAGLEAGQGERALDDALLLAVMEQVRPVPGRPHGEGWARCEEHRAFVEGHLSHGVRLSKVRKLLVRRGAEISYPTLRRFAMAELGFGRGAPTIPLADCGPAEEVQLDTGWMTLLRPDLRGKRRRFRAWIFTSVLSRHRFVYPVFPETTQTAIEACEAAWEFFGGVFKVLIVDNTKAIVQTADPLSPRITAGFLEYAQARGFVIDTTRVRKPKDKARVERAVQTVRDDCFAGEELSDLEQARIRGRVWCLEEYGLRRHTRTQRLPREHFENEERAVLLRAPTEPYDVPVWAEPKVARDQHAQVAKALYSLPTRYVGKILRARADRTTVRFYDGTLLVKAHPRMPAGKRSTDPSDFPAEKTAYALRDVGYLARKAAEHGPSVGRFAQRLLEGDLPWTRMRQVYALIGLAKRYGSSRLEEACAKALAVEMLDVHRLRRLLEIAPLPSVSPAHTVVPFARHLRPASQYTLPLTRPKQGEDA